MQEQAKETVESLGLKSRAIELMDYVTEAIKSGADFAGDQAPKLVSEVIAYGRAFWTAMIVVALILLVGGGVAMIRRSKAWYEWSCSHDCPHFGYFVAIPSMIAGTTIFFTNLDAFLKSWFAPRLYVIEWIGKLF